jgi:hypothetical protein
VILLFTRQMLVCREGNDVAGMGVGDREIALLVAKMAKPVL